jgi:hypothetical protein
MLAALRELIGALDRRAPQIERPGGIRIARDAQRLRREAVARIKELMGAGSDANAYDQDLVEAIMTDDGGPHLRTAGEVSCAKRDSRDSDEVSDSADAARTVAPH